MAQPTFDVFYRDDRGRRRHVRVWADADRGYRADFRAFADVGGGREALVAPGEHWATGDQVLAQALAHRRLEILITRRQARRDGRVLEDPALMEYMELHLERKAARRAKASTVTRDRHALERVLEILGNDVRLSEITGPRLRSYVQERRRAPGRRGHALADQTILNELHAVSNLWAYAHADGLVAGENPIPSVKRLEQLEASTGEAVWLETGEAARLLAAAQDLDRAAAGGRCPYLGPIIATYLLTGGRRTEVLGLERRDVDLDGGWIHVRPNRWRGLKSRHAQRAIPLWSQLREILTPYLELHQDRALLYPNHRSRVERPYTQLGTAFAAAVAAAKIEKLVTWHTLRHTYCAHRLYTLDGGAPVSIWAVASELGHRDISLIERTYGHQLRDRDRRRPQADEVRYDVARVVKFPGAQTA